MSLFLSIGLFITFQGVPPIVTALKALGVMTFITIFAYALNDTMDADLDKFSPVKSKRSIPSGLMTKKQALLLSAISGIIGVALSLTTNLRTILLTLIYVSLGYCYSVPPIRLKKRLLMKETITTIGILLSMFIGSAVAGRIPSSLCLPGLFLCIAGLMMSPAFNDTLDIEEDRRGGCKTIAMILSQRRRIELSTFGLLSYMVVTTLTYGYFDLNIICPIVTVFASFLFLRYIFPFLIKPEVEYKRKDIEKGYSILKIFVLIIPLSIIIGSLQL